MATFEEIVQDKKAYPDETKITLADGVETNLGQIRSGFMRQADYTRKTQDVARAKDEFDREHAAKQAAIADAEQRLQELAAQVIRTNPNLQTRDEVAEALERDPVAKRLAGEVNELKQTIVPLAQAVVEIDKRMKQSAMEYMADQHRKVIAGIKQNDPELNEQELVEYAKTNFIPRLDHAYKLYKYDANLKAEREKAAKEAEQKGYDRAKREAATAPLIPIRRPVAPAPDAPKDLDEALERAKQDETVIGPLFGLAPRA